MMQTLCVCMCALGVTKVVTVDIRGSWQRWLKVRDLTKGMTYCFRVQAKTIAYGPEAEANITAGPVKGELHNHNQTNTPTNRSAKLSGSLSTAYIPHSSARGVRNPGCEKTPAWINISQWV